VSGMAFELTAPLPTGRTLIEASAGTGKTYSIAVLVTRFVAGDLAHNHDLAEGIDIDEVLVVTYTRAAAAELRDRIRLKLRVAADYLDGSTAPPGDEWLTVFDAGTPRVRQRRSTRLRRALARFDEATITTIHGFCQQALAQSGLRAGAAGNAELIENDSEMIAEVVRDQLLERLADSPLELSPDRQGRPLDHRSFGPTAAQLRRPLLPADVERHVVATVRAVLSNPGARCEPPPAIGGLAGAWSACVADAVAEVERRQRARRQIGYDRLVSDLAAALADPREGPQLAAQLAARYRLVLVDEFQDTDRLQWEIFDRAFAGHRLVTVGDPKQAIFRFRGADVHAYLDAVRSAERVSLRTNHRSDRQLLDALGLLFDGARLGHADIEFARVDPSPSVPHNALGETAVHVRVVPDDPDLPRTSQGLEAGGTAALVLADVASRVRALLDTGAINTGRKPERLKPSDIGILVPSQRRATETANVLREWGIPTVRARTGSVLDSEAAMQWRLLLAGLATPTYSPVARAAGLSWFFDIAPHALVATSRTAQPDGDSPLARLQRRLAALGERMRRDGVGALYEELRATPDLLDAVLGRPNGDRDLTDLDHLAELIVAELAGRPTEPAAVAEAFDRMIATADDQSEASMRRVETDSDAVHITTVHSAKGLEYPVVLVPFAYTERASANRPYVFNDESGRVVDVASWVAWGVGVDEGSKEGSAAAKERKRLATVEVDGDTLRLLYVALTRAKHHLEIWWAPTRRAGTSALGRLLLDRWGAGTVFNSPLGDAYEKADPAMASKQIDALVAASNGTIARFDVPLEHPVRTPLSLPAAPASLLAVANSAGRHPLADPARRTWSFTALTAGLAASPADHVASVPVAGGYDEAPGDTGEADEDVGESVVSVGDAAPLVAAPGGTTFGIAVHEVLERVDFTSPTLGGDIEDLVAAVSRRSGLELDVAATAKGLRAVVDTPLGELFDGRPLAEFSDADRLAELTFDLTFGSARIAAADIGKVLSTTLDATDHLSDYGHHLTSALAVTELAGWLTGSIDAVFRVGTTAPRFVVVDYKSNRLHDHDAIDPLAAYRPDLLGAAMTHSHYPLQAVLYCVALHRYLGWRLGTEYSPARHLGGVAYLFVRGMIGAATPTLAGETYGVFSWRPPTATILALDALLRGAS
jgi:exodeoxyribonuclease V beta subunit